jgi:zinc transport system permease protein
MITTCMAILRAAHLINVEKIMPDFLIYAILAGCGVAMVTGPLGSFIVWRRMAYFGDTLAHSALLGTALGIAAEISTNLAVICVSLVLALALVALQKQRQLASDTILGIFAHSTLALGMVVIALMPDVRVDFMALLFGDLLAVSKSDVIVILTSSLIALALLIKLWRPLLAITINEDLARVEGVPVTAVRTALMLIIALTIAIAMKVVGALLITALMVIPAAAARNFSSSPEQMAVKAGLIGLISVLLGLASSWYLDTPAGPSVVLSASLIFLFGLLTIRKEK